MFQYIDDINFLEKQNADDELNMSASRTHLILITAIIRYLSNVCTSNVIIQWNFLTIIYD